MSGAAALTSDNTVNAGKQILRSAANNEFNSSAQQWLNQFGTARVEMNLDDEFKLDGSAIDVLLPLYDNQQSILFTQLGVRNKDNRNTVNIGAGVRTFHNNWMYGMNTFLDKDITGKNQRIGVGAEAWTDYLKLSANSYIGTTDWHQSRDFADYDERPANGYDVRAEAYLPSHPQLGGKVMYEQYRGDEVALFGKDARQKDPHAITAGVNYTPIPLVTIGVEHRAGKSSNNDSSINFQLNYRLNESWQSHINPSAVAATRTLAGSRYDLVERNNNIVMDYQKQELLRLTLPASIHNDAGMTVNITADVATKYGLDHIKWDSPALIAAGGSIKQLSTQVLQITLPLSVPNSSNRYPLTAVAYDIKGNVSNQAKTLINVNTQSVTNSALGAEPQTLPANGSATSEIIIKLRDNNSKPISGMSEKLALSMNFATDSGSQNLRNTDIQEQLRLDEVITEISPGDYRTVLTAGTRAGNVTITSSLGSQSLDSTVVTLTQDTVVGNNSSLTVAPSTIVANGSDAATLTFTAQGANNNPIRGLAVTFALSGAAAPGSTVGPTTDNGNGTYTANLTGQNDGVVTVVPKVAEIPVTGAANSKVVTLTSPDTITGIVANGHTFAVDAGFPTTGFAGAKFQMMINGNTTKNSDYNWSSDNISLVSIDTTGSVTFRDPANAPSSEIKITANPKAGGSALSYTFRITDWFSDKMYGTHTNQVARDTCQDAGKNLPPLNKLTNGHYTRGIGSLWAEWGNLRDNFGFYNTLWASNSSGTNYGGIDSDSGISWYRSASSSYQGWICWEAL
ncbi:inverse autotransporter beta domain-containing protein [Yersinia hibernica]|uniref:inverse autotransporter beta domain-containing protein n=1 Tax=Yersinia hibernica TaxID=2339259 RepID=UPI00139017EF|nr:inverse autotransporter beta domain-containing protein [Yersinia hibernica]